MIRRNDEYERICAKIEKSPIDAPMRPKKGPLSRCHPRNRPDTEDVKRRKAIMCDSLVRDGLATVVAPGKYAITAEGMYWLRYEGLDVLRNTKFGEVVIREPS